MFQCYECGKTIHPDNVERRDISRDRRVNMCARCAREFDADSDEAVRAGAKQDWRVFLYLLIGGIVLGALLIGGVILISLLEWLGS